MEHPITPPPELLQQWCNNPRLTWLERLRLAYAAGADQELEACCEELHQRDCAYLLPSQLRAARRPRPPSLKEQALAALEQVEADFNTGSFGDTIRRALEALPND
jgi:hypothetical protein